VSEVLLKMRFFHDGRVSSVLEFLCISYTLRFCARCFLALKKKSLFLGALLPVLFLQAVMVQAEEAQDPMQPPAFALEKFRQAKFKNRIKAVKTGVKVKKSVVKPMQLTSIIYSPDRKIAIIDDRMLRVGDTIRNAKLIRINRNSARLLKKGKFIELNLSGELTAIKKTRRERKL
jgi:hypothetical protein